MWRAGSAAGANLRVSRVPSGCQAHSSATPPLFSAENEIGAAISEAGYPLGAASALGAVTVPRHRRLSRSRQASFANRCRRQRSFRASACRYTMVARPLRLCYNAIALWGRGETADAQVLGTCGAIREGSTPSVPTSTSVENAARGPHFCIRQGACARYNGASQVTGRRSLHRAPCAMRQTVKLIAVKCNLVQ